MKPTILKAAALMALMALPAAAQFNSPQAKGYVARAAAMLSEHNYQGCVDQCTQALRISPADRETAMWLSAVAAFQGGMADASARLGAFIGAFPASPKLEQARLMQASLIFFSGDYAKALPALRAINADSLEPGRADDLTYRTAYCLQMLGDYAKASELFARLAKSRKYADASAFYRGYAAYAQGDFDTAEQLFASVADTSREPGCNATYYLAQIAYSRADFDRVLSLARPLMRNGAANPEFAAEGRRLCGESLYALGRESEGVELLRQYWADNSDKAPASTRYVLGVDSYRRGRCDEAIELLSSPLFTANAMGQNAALFLGLSQLAVANNSAAILAFQRAIDMDFDADATETAFYNYAVARVEGGRVPFGNSISTLEEFLKRFPRSKHAPTVQEYLVNGYIGADDYEAALRSINALRRPSEQVLAAKQRVHFVLGTRAYSSGNYPAAEKHFREAEKLASHSTEIARQNTLWLGDALYAQGDYSGAEKQYRAYLTRAPKNDPNVATATYNLGYALFGSRQYPAARERLTVAAKAPALGTAIRADAYNRIADTYYYQSQFSPALENYRLALDTDPSTGDYSMLQQAMMLGLLGKQQSKIETLDLMVERYPHSALAADALTEKALTYASSGKRAEAIAVYHRVSTAYPATAQARNAMLQLAIQHLNSGERATAIDSYKRVIATYPSSAEAAMAVQDLTRLMGEDDRIDELTAFLASVDGAPQADSVELNAMAAASLLRKVRAAAGSSDAIALASELLTRYPDSEGAEEALAIRADALMADGRTEEALADFTALDARASTAAMHHRARMGILATAAEMGRNDLLIATARSIKSSAAGSNADLPRVNYLLACALHDSGSTSEAMRLWADLAATPADLYGTRAAISMAEALHDAGSTRKAMDTVNALIDANPPHSYWVARAFILLSDLLRSQGSTFEADEYLRALRTNYPGSDADIFQMIDQRLPKQ